MTDEIIPIEEARRRKAEQETDDTPQETVEENDEVRSSQRDKLIACAADAKLWHDPGAPLSLDDHRLARTTSPRYSIPL